ncbi:ATP-dependent helicase rhp16-like isoform X1 [Hibiscus syriacus]|uniref:Endoplasmic reticulum transmembrane protein n=2 Tax=Hibiscus syriacus TaxID=106335 RepID=A0A6A3CEB3_HIBSY|nr:ATP-dependent helicase rhp16-like isoform X1 [Hibiscus syriacus]
MALVLVLLFTSPLRKLVIKILDKMKEGKGPVVSKTVLGTLFVVFISITYNVVEIQKRSFESGLLNPTDEVLMANRILEASLMGFAIFLALVTYRLHHYMKELETKRRKEAAEEMKPMPHLKLADHEEYPKKAISST